MEESNGKIIEYHDKNGEKLLIKIDNIKKICNGQGKDTYIAEIGYPKDIYENNTIMNTISFEIPEEDSKYIPALLRAFSKNIDEKIFYKDEYNFIGSIEMEPNGKIFYNYSNTPRKDIMSALQDENYKLAIKNNESSKYNNLKVESKNGKIRRLENPYFIEKKGLDGKEGYDLVNLKTGSIITLRGRCFKAKDVDTGRYIYIFYYKEIEESEITTAGDGREYFEEQISNEDIECKKVIFTVPTKLEDIIKFSNDSYQNMEWKKSIQEMLSRAQLKIKYSDDALIDIGGVLEDGEIIDENTTDNGVSLVVANEVEKHKIEERYK